MRRRPRWHCSARALHRYMAGKTASGPNLAVTHIMPSHSLCLSWLDLRTLGPLIVCASVPTPAPATAQSDPRERAIRTALDEVDVPALLARLDKAEAASVRAQAKRSASERALLKAEAVSPCGSPSGIPCPAPSPTVDDTTLFKDKPIALPPHLDAALMTDLPSPTFNGMQEGSPLLQSAPHSAPPSPLEVLDVTQMTSAFCSLRGLRQHEAAALSGTQGSAQQIVSLAQLATEELGIAQEATPSPLLLEAEAPAEQVGSPSSEVAMRITQ